MVCYVVCVCKGSTDFFILATCVFVQLIQYAFQSVDLVVNAHLNAFVENEWWAPTDTDRRFIRIHWQFLAARTFYTAFDLVGANDYPCVGDDAGEASGA